MEIEVRALTSLKHEHIVEFFFVERIRNTVLLFLEYMEGVRKIKVNQNMLALILYINSRYYTVARRYELFFRVAALVRKILFLPRENKIHIFKPPCIVLFIGDFTNQNATQPETSPEVICSQSAPVPVSGTVDKDTRHRRSRVSLLSLFCISLLCLL